jgi:5-methylcytosine-specific restriction endonuclease McrA
MIKKWADPQWRAWAMSIRHSPEVHDKYVQSARSRAKNPEWIAKISGPKNHFYISGKHRDPYGPEWTPALKESIKKRDNDTCQRCGVVGAGKGFHVHHIDQHRGHNEPENLIVLCRSCHNLTHIRDQQLGWTYYYQDYQRGRGVYATIVA